MSTVATINIGGAERPLDEASANWIKEQLGSRKDAGQNVCVRVSIHSPGINIGLRTPACALAGGGGRPPNEAERHVLDLWHQHRLDTNEFSLGQLVAFVQQVKRM